MNIAVIFAGGVGKRMKTKGLPKQFLKIDGVPILVHTLRHFQNSGVIDAIVVVMLDSYIGHTRELVREYGLTKVADVVPGGSTGQESIYHGLLAAEKLSDGPETVVLIHDGVRPIVEDGLIEANVRSVREFGSAVSSVRCKETIVTVDEESRRICDVPDRNVAWIARAPQSFFLRDILALHRDCREKGINDTIDSCTMMRNYGRELHVVETSSTNIKVTTPEDYYLAEAIIQMEEGTKEKV